MNWLLTRRWVTAVCLAMCIATAARGVTVRGQAGAPDGEPSPAANYFSDVVMVNQDGEEVRFYSDLLQGKIVVINTIFTTCTGVCPVMSKAFTRLQEHLGDRLGRDVHLISISVDPENDTPERLKAFGSALGARAGWYLLTGERENVDIVLNKLGAYVEEKESHSAIMLVGNEPTGLWKKAFGLANSEDLIKILDSVLDDRLHTDETR